MSTKYPMFGLDYLGGAKFKDLILREHPEGWAAGFFWNVDGFGPAKEVIEAVAKQGRAPTIRVHLMWRDEHDFTPAHFPEIIKRAQRLRQITDRYWDTRWYVSGACEHRLSAENASKLLTLLNGVYGDSVTLVNSPDHSGALVDPSRFRCRVINEVHNTRSAPDKGEMAFSFDGLNCVDADVTKYKQKYLDRSEYFMLWSCQMNGRLKEDDKTPRRERKAYPTMNEIDSWIYLSRDKGATKPPQGWTLKSHADRHDTPPEARAGKPVYITPKKLGSQIELVCNNGQIVGVGKYGGIFKGGGYMYRFSEFGYLMAEKAKRIHGSPIVLIRSGGKILGTVNPAFRDGKFR